MAAITVTTAVLRSTASKIETDLEHAIAIANGYVSHHEETVSAGLFRGDGAGASLATAGHLNDKLQQTITGCQRLIHGLRQAAALMEQHEYEAAHSFNGLFGDIPTSV